jgi:uncharacterized protein
VTNHKIFKRAIEVENLMRPVEDRNRLSRVVWVSIGILTLSIGLIGIALPILPTTPFLLATAYCFSRGSLRFYTWLTTNRAFGRYVRDYYEGRGISRRAKIATLLMLWTTIGISIAILIHPLWLRVILVIVGVAVSYHIATLGNNRARKASKQGLDGE